MILHIIARLNVGGTSEWIKNLIYGFEAENIQSLVLAGEPQSELKDELYLDSRVRVIEGWGKKSSLKNNIQAFIEIRRIIKKEKPTVINTHTAKAGIFGRLAARSLIFERPRIVHTIHGHYLHGYSRPLVSKIWLFNEAILSSITDSVVCVGTQVRDDLLKTRLFSSDKLIVALPGFDFSKTDMSKVGVITKPGKIIFTVGWMGRLEYVKNPGMFKEIAHRMPQINFIMVGSGSLGEDIRRSAPANLRIISFLKPEELWSKSDLAASTSLNEGVPTTLVEANAFHIPIVAPRVGSIGDVVISGVNGILLDFANVEEFCSWIKVLSEDREIYLELKRGCSTISPKFAIARMIARHQEIYQIVRK